MNVNIDVNAALDSVFFNRFSEIYEAMSSIAFLYAKGLIGAEEFPDQEEIFVVFFLGFFEHASHITDKKRIYKYLDSQFGAKLNHDRLDMLIGSEKNINIIVDCNSRISQLIAEKHCGQGQIKNHRTKRYIEH
jgi:hypothetical protein